MSEVARAIAIEMGDDFDHAFISKSEWNAARGDKGGRYRDINEPRQSDYLDAAQAAIAIVVEKAAEVCRQQHTDALAEAEKHIETDHDAFECWEARADQASLLANAILALSNQDSEV